MKIAIILALTASVYLLNGCGGGASSVSELASSGTPTSLSQPTYTQCQSQIQLSSLNGHDSSGDSVFDGFKLNGVDGHSSMAFADGFGTTLAGGDLNKDGYSDMIIGAPYGEAAVSTGANEGEVYVYFGNSSSDLNSTANGINGHDMSSLTTDTGFVIRGIDTFDAIGSSLAVAPDIDGDLFPDLLIGDADSYMSGTQLEKQMAHLFFGSTSLHTLFPSFSLSAANSTIKASYEGHGFQSSGSHFAAVVQSAGDVDNDGYTDFLIGQPSTDITATDAGAVYLVFGGPKAALTAQSNFTSMGAQSVEILGPAANYFIGRSVAGVGDINKDGYDDFAIGSTASSSDHGRVYIIFGQPRTSLSIMLTQISQKTAAFSPTSDSTSTTNNESHGGLEKLNGSNGGFIVGSSFVQRLAVGAALTALKDFNGDGFDDFAIGSPGGFNSTSRVGMVHVIFGKATFANINIATDLMGASSNGINLMGPATHLFGAAIAGGGDYDGDGLSDLIVSSEHSSGLAFVYWGTQNVSTQLSDPFGAGQVVYFSSTDFASGGPLYCAGTVLITPAPAKSVSNLGDINNDGFADFGVGIPGTTPANSATNYRGQVFVIYGQEYRK